MSTSMFDFMAGVAANVEGCYYVPDGTGVKA